MTAEGRELEELLDFVYMCPLAIAQVDRSGMVEMMNPAYAQLLMQLDPDAGTTNMFEVLASHAPELRANIDGLNARSGIICENLIIDCGLRFERAPQPLVLSLSLIKLNEHRLMATLTDVSRATARAKAAVETERRLDALLNGVRDYAILSLGLDTTIVGWNRSADRLFGFDEAEVLGHPVSELLALEDRKSDRIKNAVTTALDRGWGEDEGWWARKATTRFWGNAVLSVIEDPNGEPSGFTFVLRDLSQRKRDEDELRDLANTDPLTGLYNRRHLLEAGSREVARWRRQRQECAVLMIDADHFKLLNDTHGHAAGDQALRALARICREQVRDLDLVARFGGEEFVVLLPGTDAVGARAAGERIRTAVEAHREKTGATSLRLTISIGVATSAPDVDDFALLLEHADSAMYSAKMEGRNRVVVHGV